MISPDRHTHTQTHLHIDYAYMGDDNICSAYIEVSNTLYSLNGFRCQSLLVSLWITPISANPGIKVNAASYCDVLLSQQLLHAVMSY